MLVGWFVVVVVVGWMWLLWDEGMEVFMEGFLVWK